MKNRVTDSIKTLEISYLCIGDYIACMYDYNWFVGLVEDVREEEGDVRVCFMHPKGPGRPKNCFYWPARGDIGHIPESGILGKISAPIPSLSEELSHKQLFNFYYNSLLFHFRSVIDIISLGLGHFPPGQFPPVNE